MGIGLIIILTSIHDDHLVDNILNILIVILILNVDGKRILLSKILILFVIIWYGESHSLNH
jgi:hypothetical protein